MTNADRLDAVEAKLGELWAHVHAPAAPAEPPPVTPEVPELTTVEGPPSSVDVPAETPAPAGQ